jgi:hypothetical protein
MIAVEIGVESVVGTKDWEIAAEKEYIDAGKCKRGECLARNRRRVQEED